MRKEIHTMRAVQVLCVAILIFGIGIARAQTNSLKVGVIGPFTGPAADFGRSMLQGVQLAAAEVNAVGGYLGRPIELVIKDDKANPDEGYKQSQAFAAEKVSAVLGFCSTGVAAKSLEVFQAAKLPLIIPCATGSPLTTKFPAPESYIFRNAARDSIQAPFVVDDIIKRGLTRVAIFADSTGYGDAGLKDVEKALEAKKIQAVYVARFPLGVKDLSAELKAARDAGANVIFSYGAGPELAAIALGRQAMKWKVQQVGAWALSSPFFMAGAKESAEGALMAQTFIAEPSNERRAAFLSAYTKQFQSDRIVVPMAAAQAYDALYLLVYSLFAVRDGNLSGPALKKALENIPRNYYGVVATYEKPFSLTDKEAISQNMLIMGVVKNGKVTYARPEDAKRSLFVQRKQ